MIKRFKYTIATAFTGFVVALACLAGCGSAGDGVDTYKQDCMSNGGTYIDDEFDSDSCVYGPVQVGVNP